MGRFHDEMRAGSTTARVKNWVLTGWYGQHTNPVRAARRQAIKTFGGIRRYKKAQRAVREQC